MPLLYGITLVRLITFRSATFARSLRISSCTPSAKKAFSCSLLRLLNGSTAMLFSGGAAFEAAERSDSVLQIITPNGTAKTRSIAAITAILGLRRIHFLPRVTSPVRRARIGWCFSQRSTSSASASAEAYRRLGSFSRHLRQIVLRSRSTFGFKRRGCRGSVSSSNLIVSYVVPPAKGG